MDLIGQTLGQYRIVEPIGAGGMATVYKAYQAGLDRYVAIKVLPAQHALTPGFKERFFREAKAVAQLSHPNILPIYDVGLENDVSYFAMKYVPGKTLRDVMKKQLTLGQICGYIEQIAGALDHAHKRGILHRDIKPVNVLMEEDWLLLADFGLAKIVEGSEALTATGASMGTPAYVSPEQAVGKPVDHHTDIYSLGIVLYEMVLGKVPYGGETPMGVMFKHVYEPLPLPRQIRPNVPEAVERVILKALAKDPADRHDSAGALARALRQAVEQNIADEPVFSTAIPTSPDQLEQTIAHQASPTASPAAEITALPTKSVTPPLRKRSPWLWFGLAFLVLALVGGVIFWTSNDEPAAATRDDLIMADRQTDEAAAEIAQATAIFPAEETAEASASEPETATEAEIQATESGQENESSAARGETETAEESGDTQPAQPPPTPSPAQPEALASTPSSDLPQLNPALQLGRGPINALSVNPEDDVLAVASSSGIWLYSLPELETLTSLPNPEAIVQAAAWSPDGALLASAADDGRIKIWDTEAETVLRTIAGHEDPAISLAWSPEGDRLASGSNDATVRIWDVTSGQQLSLLRGHLYEIYSLDWSPEGDRIASASRDGTVRVWDVASGGELHRLESHLDEVFSLDWSPDGSRLVSGSLDFTIRLWDPEAGQEENLLAGHTGGVLSVAWSPQEDLVASGSIDGTIRVWDVEDGSELYLLEDGPQPVIMAWLPDGEQLISGSVDGSLRLWDLADDDVVAEIEAHTSLFRDLAWSPDGSELATVGLDGAVRLWEPFETETIDVFWHEDATLLSIDWSPDGSQLVTGTAQGEVLLWDIFDGEVSQTLAGHDDWVQSVAWSPDGRQIASASDDGTVIIWDSVSGARLRELLGHEEFVNAVAWSPEGSQLASGSEDRLVIIWDALSGEELQLLEGQTQMDAYQMVFKGRGANRIQSVAWSPDGRRIAAGSSDFVIRLWDAASGAELRLLEGHSRPVLSVAWSPDSGKLASAGGSDKTVRLWDANSGRPLYLLAGATDTLYEVAWSPEGERLAAVGDDGLVHIWEVPEE